MSLESHAWLWTIPLLPLLGSAIAGILHFSVLRARRADPSAAGASGLAPWIACLAMLGSFAASVAGFVELQGLEGHARALYSTVHTWIEIPGQFRFDLGLLLDPLSSTMTLVVTGVGFLIHVYAAGYMKGDPGYAKFFAYLNLFVAAMLILVLSTSLLGLFIGWEGVGLCSYLLIGFWYEKGWPAEAAQKAFVMNRVGDACFLAGSFLLLGFFGTLDMQAMGQSLADNLQRLSSADRNLLTLAALLLFGGCCGKSAQFPLFTWLPDAMAGPTPVSALIHAATMVTSGIYLVVRLNPLFAATPEVLTVIAGIGVTTALIGGTSALLQRDIKKVLAYSTVSQLGYMFLGLGTGAFAAAIFHLVTHAFFKALLFLGAGSVIHGMHDEQSGSNEQDMHRMGGLKRHMPRTFWTFVAGAAALSGLPLMSGFFSKDEILAHAFAAGGLDYVFWGVGVLTAGITAYYTWRMVALTFFGPERFDPHHVHPHESPAAMTVPLAVLAVLSVVGGALGLPHVFLGAPHLLGEWLAPVLERGERILASQAAVHHLSAATEWILLGVGAGVALLFAHDGFHAYRRGPQRDLATEQGSPEVAGFLKEAWRIDSGFGSMIVLPLRLAAFVIAVVVDQFAIDGLVNGTGALARDVGRRVRGAASGHLASYALWMGAGAVLVSLAWMWS